MALQDVTVTINVAYPAPKIGLGRPAIFTQKTGAATYTEYSTLEALEEDFANTTATYEKASIIFKQSNRPDTVAVATYDTDIEASLESFYNRPWHFALVANDLSADQVAAATFINDKDFKFVAVQVTDDAGRNAVLGKKRTIIFNHNVDGEHLDAAAIGELASRTVGSITWKFKGLKGVTPGEFNETELEAISVDNAIAYVMKAGKAQLSEGTLANGEFIDVIHGQDWIKADMENEVQYALQQADKLPYDSRGINAVEAAATTTLERGFKNGIVAVTDEGLPDYVITTLSRDQVDAQDRAERVYPGLSFSFGLAGAIHEARVQGAILI